MWRKEEGLRPWGRIEPGGTWGGRKILGIRKESVSQRKREGDSGREQERA